MKNFLKITLFLLFSGACFQSNAQTISAEDQKGIVACYNGFMAAFEKLDPSGLPALLTENAVHIIPDGRILRGRDAVVQGMAGFMEFLKTQPKPDRQEIKNENWESQYLAPDVILTTYTENASYFYGDKVKAEKTTTTVIMRKVKGAWQAELIGLTPVMDTPPNK